LLFRDGVLSAPNGWSGIVQLFSLPSERCCRFTRHEEFLGRQRLPGQHHAVSPVVTASNNQVPTLSCVDNLCPKASVEPAQISQCTIDILTDFGLAKDSRPFQPILGDYDFRQSSSYLTCRAEICALWPSIRCISWAGGANALI
jgi:hypothetical protein